MTSQLAQSLSTTSWPLADDIKLLRQLSDLWLQAVSSMRHPQLSDDDARVLFVSLCALRHHRTRWRPSADATARLSAHYLLEAAVRLLLMEWCHSGSDDATARSELLRGDCSLRLAEAEQRSIEQAFVVVRSAEEAEAQLAGVLDAWRDAGSAERERGSLAPGAHAMLVALAGDMRGHAMPVVLLSRFERLSTVCAHRERLRFIARNASPGDRTGAGVRVWALARVTLHTSEAAAKASAEAILYDFLDPTALTHEDTMTASATASATPAATLVAMQRPSVATRASSAARGWRTAMSGSDRRSQALVLLSVFDHACNQSHGFGWSAAYTATDARPAAAVERMLLYLSDKMVNPPPLLLLLDEDLLTVARRPNASGQQALFVTRHENPFAALEEWTFAARAHSGVRGRIRGLLDEVERADAAPEPSKLGPVNVLALS